MLDAQLRKALGAYKVELLVLADEIVVCPGHGQATTIGAERRTHRFISREECFPAWPAEAGHDGAAWMNVPSALVLVRRPVSRAQTL